MYGVILAGGTGSRLHPLTQGTNKHLLPIFDKPLIYYPLTTLILAGVTNLTIISDEVSLPNIRRLLGDGHEFGLQINYISQEFPLGLPHALKQVQSHFEASDNESILMALGDNIFYGPGLGRNIKSLFDKNRASAFGIEVSNPSDFGVLEFDNNNNVKNVIEKPHYPPSNLAVPGLYHFPNDVFSRIEMLELSSRGEYEITELLNLYIKTSQINFNVLERGIQWFDGGTITGIMNSSDFVRSTQKRTGELVGSPHEAALICGKINTASIRSKISKYPHSEYWRALDSLIEKKEFGKVEI